MIILCMILHNYEISGERQRWVYHAGLKQGLLLCKFMVDCRMPAWVGLSSAGSNYPIISTSPGFECPTMVKLCFATIVIAYDTLI